MEKKKLVIALGQLALGNTLPEQKEATKRTAKIIAQLVKEGAEVRDSTVMHPRWV